MTTRRFSVRTPRARQRLVRARRRLVSSAGVALVLLSACEGERAPREGPLVVFNAGSLARPLRAALDTFARREGVRIEQESAGSLETARKLTELGKIPDVIALADANVFPQYLAPAHVGEWVLFARNRMVLAYTDRSRYADEIDAGNWWRVLLRPGVEVGRSDPELDPNGYRTLMVWQLAERAYGEPGLGARLLAASPARNVRPKEADLVGLLQAGEMDYIWSYESMACAAGLRHVILPPSVDLSDPDSASAYAHATVAVRGVRSGESVTFTGRPIVYAFAVPVEAPHRALAERFVRFLTADAGLAVLRAEGLDALDAPIAVRDSAGPPR
jgi:molybdate/tungstate transport system substrate-binding protein